MARYKSDYDLNNGDPVVNITLERLQEAEQEMLRDRSNSREEREEEREGLARQMDTLSLDERVQYLADNFPL
jgi:hypothetical protein